MLPWIFKAGTNFYIKFCNIFSHTSRSSKHTKSFLCCLYQTNPHHAQIHHIDSSLSFSLTIDRPQPNTELFLPTFELQSRILFFAELQNTHKTIAKGIHKFHCCENSKLHFVCFFMIYLVAIERREKNVSAREKKSQIGLKLNLHDHGWGVFVTDFDKLKKIRGFWKSINWCWFFDII